MADIMERMWQARDLMIPVEVIRTRLWLQLGDFNGSCLPLPSCLDFDHVVIIGFQVICVRFFFYFLVYSARYYWDY